MSTPRKATPPGIKHAPLELEHFLPYRLSILSNTVSQGIAAYPEHAHNASQLVDMSDRALYEAKKQGRDKIHAATIHKVHQN